MNRRITLFKVLAVACLVQGLASGCASDNAGRVDRAAAADFSAHVRPDGTHIIAEAPESCPVCKLYESHHDAVVIVRVEGGLGTGVVIDKDGSVVTNAHVVGDRKEVVIETFHGTTVRGTVVKTMKDADLALIRCSASDVTWVSIQPAGPEKPKVGSTVFVIGHPAGLGWTLTSGIVSGYRMAGQIQPIELLQITAAVSPGNSGGPLLDADGRWIGTVSSKLVGQGLENISFGIPALEIRRFIADAHP